MQIYYYDSDFQNKLRANIEKMLLDNCCIELMMPIFTCINELVVNAVKANYKKIFFDKYLQENNNLEYEEVISRFRHFFTSEKIQNLIEDVKKINLTAGVEVEIIDACLKVKVTDPRSLTNIEMENVSRKLDLAKRSISLVDSFAEMASDTHKEGAGLGLIFVIILLNSMGLSVDTLRFENTDSQTAVFFSVPLNPQTVANFKLNSKINAYDL